MVLHIAARMYMCMIVAGMHAHARRSSSIDECTCVYVCGTHYMCVCGTHACMWRAPPCAVRAMHTCATRTCMHSGCVRVVVQCLLHDHPLCNPPNKSLRNATYTWHMHDQSCVLLSARTPPSSIVVRFHHFAGQGFLT